MLRMIYLFSLKCPESNINDTETSNQWYLTQTLTSIKCHTHTNLYIKGFTYGCDLKKKKQQKQKNLKNSLKRRSCNEELVSEQSAKEQVTGISWGSAAERWMRWDTGWVWYAWLNGELASRADERQKNKKTQIIPRCSSPQTGPSPATLPLQTAPLPDTPTFTSVLPHSRAVPSCQRGNVWTEDSNALAPTTEYTKHMVLMSQNNQNCYKNTERSI